MAAATDPFRALVRTEGARLYRDLPWRNTRDPYAIWISEVMLQQTQVPRVLTRWDAWLDRFPSVFALAEAGAGEVLEAWQGMGYNRRALALKSAAEQVAGEYDGVFPTGARDLCALPGIGPATAQGIRSFAFDLPGVYLETNVRTVFLHHHFPDVPSVPDRELIPLVESACPGPEAPYAQPADSSDTPRAWYYALLDYGAQLKKTIPNPSRRSSSYTRQSKFEGSRRQKRAEIVRMLLDAQRAGGGLPTDEVAQRLAAFERTAGREAPEADLAPSILSDLAREGFCVERDGAWTIA
ncbi:MAG: adenine glycosylase [Coriobacteriaceae bacterium]|nr:adenine glycosylase [Coriobacteriaceae bacterium]